MKANNQTKAGNYKDADTIQNTDWALLCLAHQKNILTFELLNLKTKRAHKLIFSGSGTDDIQAESQWTEGQYYQKFNTNYPANFDNFDDTLAILTPKNAGIDHILRIGWLASIKINQYYDKRFGMWHMFGSCKIVYGSGAPSKPPIFEGYNPDFLNQNRSAYQY